MSSGHGIDCSCLECHTIRVKLRELSRSGKVYISGTEEDKKKLWKK